MVKNSFTVIITKKIKTYKKQIVIDSDKSISIRSFLIGAISLGISEVKNVLESEDVLSTIRCLKSLGVKIIRKKPKHYLVYGKGLGSLMIKKNTILNCGNSGTLARLLIGVLTSNPKIEVTLKGDHSLNKRNMSKVIDLMKEFGATFYPRNKNNFPLKIVSSEMPIGINYKSGVSAQLKSAVILAGLNSYGVTNIFEEKKSRNPTENMIMKNSNVIKIRKNSKKQNIIKVYGKQYLKPIKINVPGDPSSAAFFTALTLLNKNNLLIIKNVGLNPRRAGFYKLLKEHGAYIKFKNIKKVNNEIIGDIIVKSSNLKPLKVSSKYYVSATDEFPILFVIAALTSGVSNFKGIEDLANKESNRIIEMQNIFKQIGIRCKSNKDQMIIYGTNTLKNNKSIINVPNLGDHRICMSTAILSLTTGIKSKIKNFETVYTSSPSFLKTIKLLGGKYEIKKIS
jgi:3-phosphoshikimate 1-carboxyvinyltransferase